MNTPAGSVTQPVDNQDIFQSIFQLHPHLSTYPRSIALIRFVSQEIDKQVYQGIEYEQQHHQWAKCGQKGDKPVPPAELSPLVRQALSEYRQHYYPQRTTEEAFEIEQRQYRELVIMNNRLEAAERDSSLYQRTVERQKESIAEMADEIKRLKDLAEGLRKMVLFYDDGTKIQNFLN